MSDYKLRIDETESGVLEIRVAEIFYHNDKPFTEFHRLTVSPGDNLDEQKLLKNIGGARPNWVNEMQSGGHSKRISDIVNAVIPIVHTPDVVADFKRKNKP